MDAKSCGCVESAFDTPNREYSSCGCNILLECGDSILTENNNKISIENGL